VAYSLRNLRPEKGLGIWRLPEQAEMQRFKVKFTELMEEEGCLPQMCGINETSQSWKMNWTAYIINDEINVPGDKS
jgi:hypothetical protein